MLDWLWPWYDIVYRWLHRVEDLPGDGQTVIRIGVGRHRGRRVALKDGTLIQVGALVGTIHLNNERIRTIHDRTANPARAGILIRRAFERSLEALARVSDTHPRYHAVKAFTATTIFHKGTERFGFEVLPPPATLFRRIVAAYERSLLARFHPLGASRVRRKRFDEVRMIWISRPTLRRRYPPKSSPRDTGS